MSALRRPNAYKTSIRLFNLIKYSIIINNFTSNRTIFFKQTTTQIFDNVFRIFQNVNVGISKISSINSRQHSQILAKIYYDPQLDKSLCICMVVTACPGVHREFLFISFEKTTFEQYPFDDIAFTVVVFWSRKRKVQHLQIS